MSCPKIALSMITIAASSFLGVIFQGILSDRWVGNLGESFAMLSVIVLVALIIQVSFLRPKANDFDQLTKGNHL